MALINYTIIHFLLFNYLQIIQYENVSNRLVRCWHVTGAMYDYTGNYNVPFAVNGLLIAISGAMIYCYYCMPVYHQRCKAVAAEARKKLEAGNLMSCHC